MKDYKVIQEWNPQVALYTGTFDQCKHYVYDKNHYNNMVIVGPSGRLSTIVWETPEGVPLVPTAPY